MLVAANNNPIHGPIFGALFALFAIGMAAQTIYGFRRGFTYCGQTERIYKTASPKKFIFWVFIQSLLVIMLLFFSVIAFLL